MTTNTNFPVFAANQVLKNDHLNDLVNYLEEQTRITRCKTIGIGILCGFHMEWSSARDNQGREWDTLNLSEGLGITSSGYLIHSPKLSFSHRRKYLKKMELSQLEELMASNEFYQDRYQYYRELADIYEFFKDDTGNDIEELFELVPVANDKAEATSLSRTFLNDKVLLVYLNCDLQSLKNCDVNDCDDKGAKLQFEIRYLLATEAVAKKIYIKEKANEGNFHMPIHIEERPYSKLKNISLKKLDFSKNLTVFHRDLFNQYVKEVKLVLTQFKDELKVSFVIFDFLLNGIYSAGNRSSMFAQIDLIIKNISSLKGNQRLQIQYFYDFTANLLDAYHEFIQLACEHHSLCSEANNLFPKHLMLGKLKDIEKNLIKDNEYTYRNPFITTGEGFFPLSETSISYRHAFISSPQGPQQQNIIYKMQSAHFKMYEMLLRFNPLLIINKLVAILPSHTASFPLSERSVIPGYFPISDKNNESAHKLKQLWSYNKTTKGRLQNLFSIHTHRINNPLQFRQTNSDFYRIEGHIGKTINEAVTEIVRLRAALGLDFEIKIVHLNDELTSKSMAGIPVNLFSSEIKKYPGLEHMGGVPVGGTFYLAYHTVSSRPVVLSSNDQIKLGHTYLKALGSVSNDLNMLNTGRELVEELSSVSNKHGVYSEEVNVLFKNSLNSPKYNILKNTPLAEILVRELDDLIINPSDETTTAIVSADFALSYVCCKSEVNRSSLGVMECKYPWMDNFQFLNRFSWDGNLKDYVLEILEYSIGNTKIINSRQQLKIKITAIAHQKLKAIISALNLKYPTGLVLGTDANDKSKFNIKYFKNQTFILKFRREGSTNIYTYTEKEWLKNGKRVYNYKSDCKLLPLKYNSEHYKSLHEEFAYTDKFVYEFPPSHNDHKLWADFLKNRSVANFTELPKNIQTKLKKIRDVIMGFDGNAKIGLGGSWKKGSWTTKDTLGREKEFVKMRKKMTGKRTLSDLDIVIESKLDLKALEILEKLEQENVNIIGIEKISKDKYIEVPKR